MMKRWFTLREASHYSGISRYALKKFAKEHEIRGYQSKRGRMCWYFDRQSLDEFHEKNCTSAYNPLVKKLIEEMKRSD